MLMKAVYTYLKLPNVAFKIYFNTNKNPVSKKPKPKKNYKPTIPYQSKSSYVRGRKLKELVHRKTLCS